MAATPLTADPVAAPLLLVGGGRRSRLTATALGGLAPRASSEQEGAQILTVGDVAAPDDLETLAIEGSDAAEVADAIDRERAKLTGEEDPAHLLVVSSEDSAAPFSMPAAAWAARSGDPILFVAGDEVPEATTKVDRAPPEGARLRPRARVGDLRQGRRRPALEGRAPSPIRIGDEDPVENSIEFARFVDGDFGWNINDPGHGFVIANADRPLDAAAASPLSAGGKPGPLLITDDAESHPGRAAGLPARHPARLRGRPSRAVYNHVWLIGDRARSRSPSRRRSTS